MPADRRIGLQNPSLGGREQSHGRPVHFARRPVQPQMRRGIDGFALPPQLQQKAKTSDQGTGKDKAPHRPKVASSAKPALPRQSRSNVLVRPAPQKLRSKTRPLKSRRSRMPILFSSMAIMVFMGAGVVSYLGWKTSKHTATQAEVLSSAINHQGSDVPAENTTHEADSSYSLAPDMPHILKIPRLNVEARVTQSGVKSNGTLEAPTNIFDAGWYEGSSKPGEIGAVVINGHVHGPTKPGIFYRLNNLKEGDSVEIERGDGKIYTYKVVTTENVDQEAIDMTKVLKPVEAGRPGLNLITHSGRYDIRTNKYEQRLIVYLVQQ